MRQWEEKDLKFILDKKRFPKCIECDGHFFHKNNCSRSPVGPDELSVPWEVINERLNQRLEEFEKDNGINGSLISCKECKNKAIGEMHVLYHGTNHTVESWPVCMDHAFHEDISGRECQFRGF